MAAHRSAQGIAHHAPSSPKTGGKRMMKGIRKMIWRESARKMETFALPMDWKKLEVTTWNPTMNTIPQHIRIARAVSRITSWLSVKARAMYSGISCTAAKPTILTIDPHFTASL